VGEERHGSSGHSTGSLQGEGDKGSYLHWLVCGGGGGGRSSGQDEKPANKSKRS